MGKKQNHNKHHKQESNLFDTQKVFLKEFFEKVDFEKKSADDKKSMKNFRGGKELKKAFAHMH